MSSKSIPRQASKGKLSKTTRISSAYSLLTELYKLCHGRAVAYEQAGMLDLAKMYYDRAFNLRYTLEYLGNML